MRRLRPPPRWSEVDRAAKAIYRSRGGESDGGGLASWRLRGLPGWRRLSLSFRYVVRSPAYPCYTPVIPAGEHVKSVLADYAVLVVKGGEDAFGGTYSNIARRTILAGGATGLVPLIARVEPARIRRTVT
jgi:hypothetical protein